MHTEHEHPPHLQHHFDTPEQQYDSSKFGMWLFLATEVLLFGGLFVAYAVYRGNHPEIFSYGHHFLDKKLGAINTAVLLCSSLTMAWAVRAAQLNQRRLMLLLLSLTLLGGAGFMGIKYVEYKAKFEHGLLWARQYHPETHHVGPAAGAVDPEADAPAVAAEPSGRPAEAGGGPTIEPTLVPDAALGPEGLAPDPTTADGVPEGAEPANVQVFFSVYFLMTGLHGLHVLAGMCVIVFLIVMGNRGAYSSDYYTPVDLGGLYWHLVDLIWIFLFPLLYLID